MTNDKNRNIETELIQELNEITQRFQPGGDHGPIEDRNAWDQLVQSRGPEECALLQELTNFFDLSKFLEGRNQTLGESIVSALEQVHKLPLPERIEQLREINQELMKRVADVGANSQFRN
jgi:hypothetical protein